MSLLHFCLMLDIEELWYAVIVAKADLVCGQFHVGESERNRASDVGSSPFLSHMFFAKPLTVTPA